jgi:hypothetical protein
MLLFFVLLTIGFIFELGKGALNIYTKQNSELAPKKGSFINISLLK